jgi:uncharacterized membrane protein
MDHSIWTKIHGGTTHFPIALAMAATFLDLAGSLVPDNPEKSRRANLRAAGFYSLLLGAVGSLGAVVSGLTISDGQIWGRGDLARHHAFLWPSFGLLVGLAAWRLAVGNRASERALKTYLAASILMCGLMGAAGYYGGELLLRG